VCDRYRQALEQQFIQSNSPRPIMILAVKAKNDEIRYEAEDNDVDVVKDHCVIRIGISLQSTRSQTNSIRQAIQVIGALPFYITPTRFNQIQKSGD
jgi:hypothetical protein